MKFKLLAILGIALSVLSHAQDVRVANPTSGSTVSTTFPVSATSTVCSGLPVVSMGYSTDSNTDAKIVSGQSLNVEATVSAGNHTLRVKSWGKGTSCVTDVPIVAQVQQPLIPSYAISSGNLNRSSLWKCQHDSATGGSSSATTKYPLTLNGYTDVREFLMSSYSGYGGERCSIDFIKETTAHNFIYDVYVQFANSSQVANLELDMNQVTLNGVTVIFAFQCSHWTGTWEYTYVSNGTHWKSSGVPCDPTKWSANSWHHVQIYTSRNDTGYVTYHWVVLDGVKKDINVTVKSAEDLNWTIGANVVNFQIDPRFSSGSNLKVYTHQFIVWRW